MEFFQKRWEIMKLKMKYMKLKNGKKLLIEKICDMKQKN